MFRLLPLPSRNPFPPSVLGVSATSNRITAVREFLIVVLPVCSLPPSTDNIFIQADGEAMLERNQAIIRSVREWEPAFHIFGPTSFLGMAVLHDLRVYAHIDPQDDRRGFFVVINWALYKGKSVARRQKPCVDYH